MSDDWCLTGKKQSYTFPDALWSEEKYTAEDIETLRQKLIADIDEMRTDLFTGRNWKIVVKSIIKKRFGMEEKQ